MRKNRIAPMLAFACLAVIGAEAAAQTKLTRPVRIIVPYVQGGGTDALSRMLAPYIAEEFGQQALVENRPGASTTIGTGMVARATPDGHTIGMIDAAFLTSPSLLPSIPYDTLKDFEPIVFVARAPLVLLVHAAVPANTIAELVALAKAKPGALTFGSAGNGSGVHFAGEQFRLAAGIDIVHVPYKGSGQALVEVMGGQTTMNFTVPSIARAQAGGGKVKALGLTGAKRSPAIPNVVTFAESGYPTVDAMTINGLIAPAGTPKDYIARVNAVVNRALKSPELEKKLYELGFEVAGGTPEEFGAFIRSEIPKWAKIVREAGIKAGD